MDVETVRGLIPAAAAAEGVDAALLDALVWQESRYKVDAVSPAGAIGLTQLMPATAREVGVDPWDPWGNLTGGARYLARKLSEFGGDVAAALAAYNAGARRVRERGQWPAAGWLDRMPEETRAYVPRIMERAGLTSPVPLPTGPRAPGPGGSPHGAGGGALLALAVAAALA